MTRLDRLELWLKIALAKHLLPSERCVILLSIPGEDLHTIRNTSLADALAMLTDAQKGLT